MPKKSVAKQQVEWIGGLVSLPMYASDGRNAPVRPESVFWMLSDGRVVGTAMFEPGQGEARLVDHFHETTRKPLFGAAHVPARLRVESPEIATMLRTALAPATEVTCAPTPEIDALVAALREQLGEADQDEAATYLTPGITPEAMGAFFRAAARLFRAKPWEALPDELGMIFVTMESLGVQGAVISVIGQLDTSLGLLLFSNADDFLAYLAAAPAIAKGEAPKTLPRHFALNFDRGADMDPALRKEIAAHGWEIASADAYPWLIGVDEDVVPRPPTAEELTRFEAIAIALADAVESKSDLGEAPRTIRASTHAGPIEITLVSPYGEDDRDGEGDDAIGGRLAERSENEALLKELASSPEGSRLKPPFRWVELVMAVGEAMRGLPIAKLTAEDLGEIVFENIPRHAPCRPEDAGEIIGELLAFFTFLKRARRTEDGHRCLLLLGGDAVQDLEAAIADPESFDLMDSLERAGAPPWLSSRGAPTASTEARHATKNKRKAQRKARRKNR